MPVYCSRVKILTDTLRRPTLNKDSVGSYLVLAHHDDAVEVLPEVGLLAEVAAAF